MKIPFLPEKRAEKKVRALYDQYYGGLHKVTFPFPVDELIEIHLGIALEYDDFSTSQLNLNEKLDGFFLPEKNGKGTIWINTNVDVMQQDERRLWTLAHELGHALVHSELAEEFTEYRKNNSKEAKLVHKEMDSQANMIAAELLMPKEKVFALWKDLCPEETLDVAETQKKTDEINKKKREKEGQFCFPDLGQDYTLTYQFQCIFGLSYQAIRYRLKNLKLFKNDPEIQAMKARY